MNLNSIKIFSGKTLLTCCLFFVFYILIQESAKGQSTNFFPADHYFYETKEAKDRKGNVETHTNVWPLTIGNAHEDSILSNQKIKLKEASKYNLVLLPEGEFYTGYDFFNGNRNHVSFWTYAAPKIRYQLTDKLTVNGGLLLTTGNFWSQLNQRTTHQLTIPGNTRWVENGIVHTSLIPTGSVSYSPNKIFNFQIGQGQHFFGNGYRSVLLSYNSGPHPYFRIVTKLKRFQYTNLFSSFNHFEVNNEGKIAYSRRKFSTMHLLSWNLHKNFNLYFFEAIVWPGKDSTYQRGFDFTYLNPVVFYRPIEYSIGSSDNALMGLGWQLKLSSKLKIYGQFILDEFLLSEIKADIKHFLHPNDTTLVHGWWANKYGVQLGFKIKENVKTGLLQVIGEMNLARPFTYTHGSTTLSYTHANQALAHPLGTNFFETLLITQYQYKSYSFKAKGIFAFFGRDGINENLGGDIFKSYTNTSKIHGNTLGQGIRNDLWQLELEIARPVLENPKTILFVGYYIRSQTNRVGNSWTNYPFIGLRMGSVLRYLDF